MTRHSVSQHAKHHAVHIAAVTVLCAYGLTSQYYAASAGSDAAYWWTEGFVAGVVASATVAVAYHQVSGV